MSQRRLLVVNAAAGADVENLQHSTVLVEDYTPVSDPQARAGPSLEPRHIVYEAGRVGGVLVDLRTHGRRHIGRHSPQGFECRSCEDDLSHSISLQINPANSNDPVGQRSGPAVGHRRSFALRPGATGSRVFRRGLAAWNGLVTRTRQKVRLT